MTPMAIPGKSSGIPVLMFRFQASGLLFRISLTYSMMQNSNRQQPARSKIVICFAFFPRMRKRV